MQKPENNGIANGGFFVRLIAYLADWIIVGAVLLILRIPVWILSAQYPDNFFITPILFQFSLCDIVTYLAGAAYFILLTYYTGATVGKKLLNLKVVTIDGSPLTLWNVFYRETIGRYLSSLLFIGYIMVGASSEKRGLHDYLCDTKVIYTCRMAPQTPRYRPMPTTGAPYGPYAPYASYGGDFTGPSGSGTSPLPESEPAPRSESASHETPPQEKP